MYGGEIVKLTGHKDLGLWISTGMFREEMGDTIHLVSFHHSNSSTSEKDYGKVKFVASSCEDLIQDVLKKAMRDETFIITDE